MTKRERARPYIVWLHGTPKHLSKRLRLHRHVRNAVLEMARTEEQYIDYVAVNLGEYRTLIRAVKRLLAFEETHGPL